MKRQEQEFFASKNPDIATASNKAAREKLIKALPDTDPALYKDPWGLSFMAMLHMANDSGLFHPTGEVLPLYEAKMVHHFDHRRGTYEGQADAARTCGPSSVTTSR